MLTPSGRVAHRKQYVVDVANEKSLVVAHYNTMDDFRREQGEGTRGHVFVLRKPPGREEL